MTNLFQHGQLRWACCSAIALLILVGLTSYGKEVYFNFSPNEQSSTNQHGIRGTIHASNDETMGVDTVSRSGAYDSSHSLPVSDQQQQQQQQMLKSVEFPELSSERLQVQRSSFESLNQQGEYKNWNDFMDNELIIRPNNTKRCVLNETGNSKSDIFNCACDPFTPISHPSDRWHRWHETFVNQTMNTTHNIQVVFLGDSIMERWGGTRFQGTRPRSGYREEFEKRFSKATGASIEGRVFGSAQDTSQHLLWHIENGIIAESVQPEVIWYMVGTNNFEHNCSQTPIETYVSSIMEVANRIHHKRPNATIVVQGILPRGNTMGAIPLGWIHQQILLINKRLREVCEKHPKLHFFDAPKAMTANSSQVDTQFLSDCVHPSQDGWRLMGEIIEAEVQSLLKIRNSER